MPALITPGDRITVESATGPLIRRATTGVVEGSRFLVVWAAREEEWDAATAEGRDPVVMPWPAEDVQPLS